MRSVSEHQRLKIIRCVILTLSVSFMVFVSLRHTSNVLYDFMFTDPSSMVDWDDHIQIAIVLKGKLIKLLSKVFYPDIVPQIIHWIQESIKRIIISGLFWAVGVAEKKKSNLP